MLRRLPHLIGVLTIGIASTTHAQTIYNSLDSGTDGAAFIPDSVIDDLTVEGGGLLQSITIALTADCCFDSVFTDVSFSLAVDGGDGFPDLTGEGDDAFLFTVNVTGVEVEVGGVTEVTIDVSEFYTIIPEDSLLFAGAMFSSFNVGHLFAGEPTVGSTDDFVVSFAAMGPAPVPGFGNPKLLNSEALAIKLDVVQLPGTPIGPDVEGDVIDFEEFEEGFQGAELISHGATFFDGRDGFDPPEDRQMAIDDGTGTWDLNPDMLDFVSGKLLNLNTFTTGPDGYSFSALKSIKIDPGQVRDGAKVSIAYVTDSTDDDYSNNTITLLAKMGDDLVASHTVQANNQLGASAGGSFNFGASMLQVSGVEFDQLVIFCNGPTTFGFLLAGLDNVILGSSNSGSPADLDGDGDVDFSDLLQLLAAWGACPVGPSCPADLDESGDVGFADLLMLLNDWTV